MAQASAPDALLFSATVTMDKPELEDEHDDRPQPCMPAGRNSVQDLTDEQLLYYYDQIHHPDLIATRWVEILEEEVLRRRLRQKS